MHADDDPREGHGHSHLHPAGGGNALIRLSPSLYWYRDTCNVYLLTRGDRGLLIDFNDDTEPLPGRYPLPRIGPLRLLEESRFNHWGKLAFKWLYWNVLLPDRRLPLPTAMSMAGKKPPTEQVEIENP